MSRDGCAALPRGSMGIMQFVIVVFPDHIHLLFFLCMFAENRNQDGFLW